MTEAPLSRARAAGTSYCVYPNACIAPAFGSNPGSAEE